MNILQNLVVAFLNLAPILNFLSNIQIRIKRSKLHPQNVNIKLQLHNQNDALPKNVHYKALQNKQLIILYQQEHEIHGILLSYKKLNRKCHHLYETDN